MATARGDRGRATSKKEPVVGWLARSFPSPSGLIVRGSNMFADLLALTAQSQASTSTPFWNGAAIAAMIAAGVALLGTCVTVWLQARMSASQKKHEERLAQLTRQFTIRQRQIERREKQLNELYGPLRAQRLVASDLRRSLPPPPWPLVENIPAIKSDPGRSKIVEEILELNRASEELLLTKSGLLEGPYPDSFALFMQHSRLLRTAWEFGGELIETNPQGERRVGDVHYPIAFNEDLDRHYELIRSSLDQLMADS